MKKKIFMIWAFAGVIMLAALPATAQENQNVLRLTLDDALRIALSENLTIKVADQEIQKQQYAKKGTYASLFPQISLDGSYSRAIEKQTMTMESTKITIGTDNNWSGGLSASMPLVSASLWKSLKISALDVELAVEKARSSRIEMIDQVNQAFYTVLLAGDSYNVYKEAYDNAVNNYNDIKAKVDQGTVAEYDLVRANVNVRNAEPSLYDAENSLMLAHWQLKALIGMDLEADIECAGSLIDYDAQLVARQNAVDLSLEANSDLQQMDIQLDQMVKNVELQKSQYLPTLNASFSYNYISMNNNFKISHYRWDPYSTVGLNLSIPIFSGGQRKSNVQQAKIGLSQLETQREDTERNLKVAVKQSYDRMSTCHKQFFAAKTAVEQSEIGYNITTKRYQTGEGTMLEINDSQLSLTQSKLNLNQSIYNYLVAQSSLYKTLGISDNNN